MTNNNDLLSDANPYMHLLERGSVTYLQLYSHKLVLVVAPMSPFQANVAFDLCGNHHADLLSRDPATQQYLSMAPDGSLASKNAIARIQVSRAQD